MVERKRMLVPLAPILLRACRNFASVRESCSSLSKPTAHPAKRGACLFKARTVNDDLRAPKRFAGRGARGAMAIIVCKDQKQADKS